MSYRLNSPIVAGFTSWEPVPFMTSLTLVNANTWLELGLLPHEDLTVNEIAIQASAYGTPGTSIICELCDNAGTVIQTATSPSISGALAWYDFTGFTTPVTAMNQYWFRFRNGHGTPGSNGISIEFSSAGVGGIAMQSGSDALGWTVRETGTGGPPYTTPRRSAAGWQVKFSDGSYQGLALQSIQSSGGTYALYGARRFGVRFTAPANAHMYVKAVSMTNGEFVGTPPSGLIAEIYNPTSLITNGQSYVYPTATLQTGSGVQRASFYFATPPKLEAGGDYRIFVRTNTVSGDVFNAYTPYSLLIRNTAGSRSVLPFKGTAQQTFYNGTSWVDDPNRIALQLLFLDNEQDFGLVSVGGGASALIGGGLVR